MTSYVLDASVAVKWFVPRRAENLATEAILLLDRYRDGLVRFFVPDLFWPEFGNIMWKSVRMGKCTWDTAELAVRGVQQITFRTISSEGLLDQAFLIATSFDRTVYDSIYVAAAVASRSSLVTADEKLANAFAAHFPVKWLGSI